MFSFFATPECFYQGPAPECLYQGPVPECFYQGLPLDALIRGLSSNVSIEEPAPACLKQGPAPGCIYQGLALECLYRGSPRHVVQPGSFFSSFRQSLSRNLSLPKPRCLINTFRHDEKRRFLLNTCRNDAFFSLPLNVFIEGHPGTFFSRGLGVLQNQD